MMDDTTAKIMWRVFQWAYKNGITVGLYPGRHYQDKWPILRFSAGNKHCEYALYPLVDVTGRVKSLWKEVALELVVEPLDLSEL
jgi:hypothetical protein